MHTPLYAETTMLRERLTTTTAIQAAVPPAAAANRPAYCSIDNWLNMSGMGRRSTYDELGRGNLRAIKIGSKTLIDVEFGMKWLRSRPAAVIRAPRSRQQADATL
jgi:hypothetical protein